LSQHVAGSRLTSNIKIGLKITFTSEIFAEITRSLAVVLLHLKFCKKILILIFFLDLFSVKCKFFCPNSAENTMENRAISLVETTRELTWQLANCLSDLLCFELKVYRQSQFSSILKEHFKTFCEAILRIITYPTYVWEIDNFVIKSYIFRWFFICKNILKKLSCYHDNYFKYFTFGKYNGFVSNARISACMHFLVILWLLQYNSHSRFSRIRFAIQLPRFIPIDALYCTTAIRLTQFVSKYLETIANRLRNSVWWISLIVDFIGKELMMQARAVYWFFQT
jgi:hypothetical protein